MRKFKIIARWFRLQYEVLTSKKYRTVAVCDYPKIIAHGTVYIVSDGVVPDTIIFKCPCGCHADIYLNLLKDTRPNWCFYLNKFGKLTIHPSVWRKVGCKSHFFLRKGRINWV